MYIARGECCDSYFKLMIKFLFDRLASLVGLLLLWPIFLIVAILIKVKMPGPVLFVQERVGKDGKLFKVHKFRSMRVRREDEAFTGVAAAETSRITPLGEKLRKYKLDELPELWDVFIGKMSFVGPRPDVPGYADKLEGDNRVILKLRPGITGPGSLKYRNEEEILAQVEDPVKYNDEVIWPDKVRLNKYYYYHYSFVKDIEMIFATILGKKVKFAGEEI